MISKNEIKLVSLEFICWNWIWPIWLHRSTSCCHFQHQFSASHWPHLPWPMRYRLCRSNRFLCICPSHTWSSRPDPVFRTAILLSAHWTTRRRLVSASEIQIGIIAESENAEEIKGHTDGLDLLLEFSLPFVKEGALSRWLSTTISVSCES